MMSDILGDAPVMRGLIAMHLCHRDEMRQHRVAGLGVEAPADRWPDQGRNDFVEVGRRRRLTIDGLAQQVETLGIEPEIDALGNGGINACCEPK
jgi:hypothetical protein